MLLGYIETVILAFLCNFYVKFKIKQVTAKGGCFCETCKKYVIKGICRHKAYTDISGTEFRKYLFSNEFYQHADKNMQKLLLEKKND